MACLTWNFRQERICEWMVDMQRGDVVPVGAIRFVVTVKSLVIVRL